MLIGLNTNTLGLADIFEAIRWIRENGFDAVELSCDPGPREKGRISALEADARLVARLREACAGLRGVTLHAPWMTFPGFSPLSADQSLRARSLAEIKACIDLCRALGSRLVTIHSGRPPAGLPHEQVLALARSSLTELDLFAGERGVELGLEVADYFQPAERFADLEAMGLRNTGITADVGHLCFPNALRAGKPCFFPFASVGAFIERFASRIRQLHVHDYDGKKDHIAIGAGKMDFDDIARAIRRISYRGVVCCEFSPAVAPAEVLRSKDRLSQLLQEGGY